MIEPGRATILVSGMIASDPWHGGATWAVLQYVLGLRRLGHDVYLAEPIAPKAVRTVPGEGGPAEQAVTGTGLAASDNAAYFRRVVEEFGLADHAALVLTGTQETVGLPYDELRRVARRADLLINISGMLTDEALISSVRTRVYLDLDPAFNQLWSAVQGVDMRFAGHTHFVTIGLDIGAPHCPVPTCGLTWLKTLQPVVLEQWPMARNAPLNGWTTVANWRGYGSIEHEGAKYGQKAHSLRQFVELPTRATEPIRLALGIHPEETADLALLKANGWELVDPGVVAQTPSRYREFLQQSKGELGIAKSGYVLSQCGWFSDRSACYLASGRPVIAQETGFSRHLPTGSGLLAFRTADDVLAAMDGLRTNYAAHAHSARLIAEEHFDSDKVLGRLLDAVLN